MKRVVSLCLTFWMFLILLWGQQSFAQAPPLIAARKLIANGNLDQAVQLLRDFESTNPTNFDAKFMLGTILAIQGARSESIHEVTEAVRLRPQSAEAQNLLGTTLSRFMETESARSAFEQAIRLDPGMAEAHVNLALLLADAGDWDGAGEHLDRAIALQKSTSSSAYSHYLRAKTWIAKSQLDKADKELHSALRVQPKMAEAWSDLGWTRMMLSDDSGALRAFEKSVIINPNDSVAQYRLGTALLRQGEAAQAVQHLKVALKLGGADKPTLYNLEMALRKAGESKEAQEIRTQMAEALKATRNSSENGLQVSALNAEGIELEKQGNYAAATMKYRMALDLDPTAGGIRLNYGLSLCRQHKWQDGIAEIQEVLRADPDNGTATRALYIAKEQAEAETKKAN